MNNDVLLNKIRNAVENEEKKRNNPVLDYNINDERNKFYTTILKWITENIDYIISNSNILSDGKGKYIDFKLSFFFKKETCYSESAQEYYSNVSFLSGGYYPITIQEGHGNNVREMLFLTPDDHQYPVEYKGIFGIKKHYMSTGPITDVEAINQFKNKFYTETDGIISVLSIDDIEYERYPGNGYNASRKANIRIRL